MPYIEVSKTRIRTGHSISIPGEETRLKLISLGIKTDNIGLAEDRYSPAVSVRFVRKKTKGPRPKLRRHSGFMYRLGLNSYKVRKKSIGTFCNK